MHGQGLVLQSNLVQNLPSIYSVLTITVSLIQYPGDYVDKISFGDMGMRSSPGRTYKFYTGTPVYEFGLGLSYTTFTMQW